MVLIYFGFSGSVKRLKVTVAVASCVRDWYVLALCARAEIDQKKHTIVTVQYHSA